MNLEETEAMRSLDTRLRKLHADLDAQPGFEARLAARIAMQRAKQTRPLPADAVRRIEREHERARAQADRDARAEGLLLAIAGLGGALAAWQLAPMLGRLLATATQGTDPMTVAYGVLPVAAALVWTVLRRFDVDPRRLVGV